VILSPCSASSSVLGIREIRFSRSDGSRPPLPRTQCSHQADGPVDTMAPWTMAIGVPEPGVPKTATPVFGRSPGSWGSQGSRSLPAEMSSQAGIALQAQQVKSAILFQAINLLVKLIVHHERFIPSASSRECGCATAFSSHARTCCSSNTRKPMQRSSTCLTNTTASTYFHASQSTVSYIIQTHLSAAVRRLTADSLISIEDGGGRAHAAFIHPHTCWVTMPSGLNLSPALWRELGAFLDTP
jgi:hypothetical protein